jgi:hypothetical protein
MAESTFLTILYVVLIVAGVLTYRWGIRKFVLSEDRDPPRLFWNPIQTLAVLTIPFLLWISGIVGLFNQSAKWGVTGLIIALLSLFSVVIRRSG